MFCEKCGTQLKTGASFCENCGEKAKIPAFRAVAIKEGSEQKPNPLKSVPKKVWGAAGAGALVVIAVIAILLNMKTSVSLNKYVSVEFNGYDTKGTATASFDKDAFLKDYKGKIKYRDKKKMSSYWYDNAAEAILDSYISGDLEATEELTNGDVVTYRWECDNERALEEFGCKLKYEDIEFTVKGLSEIQSFNPFEKIEVVYSGIGPNAEAEVVNNSDDALCKELNYTVEPSSGLSNGDKVTVTVSEYWGDDLESYCIENYGMRPSETQMTYTVEGLGSYVTKIDEISDDMFEKMKQQAEDVIRSDAASDWNEHESLDGVSFMGCYLLVAKQSDSYSDNNMLRLVFKIDASDNYNSKRDGFDYHEKFSYYYYVSFSNIVTMDDGTCSVELSDYNVPYNSFSRSVQYGEEYWDFDNYYYSGYEKLDSLFNDSVTAYIDQYSYESTVDEKASEKKTGKGDAA